MKVLLLEQFSDPGGAQQSLAELLPAMRGRGWDTMVGLPGNGELLGRIQACGVRTELITCGPYTSGRKSAMDAVRFLVQTPKLTRQISQLAKHFKPDLLYVNGPRLLPSVALARLATPVVFHCHSYLTSQQSQQLAGASVRHSSAAVIANCEFVARPWRRFAGDERIAIVYNGVAGPNSETASKERRLSPAIGCISRIAPEKGLLDFLNAARRIHDAVPDCRFLIFGSPLFATAEILRYDAEVRSAATGLPVEFRGWSRDIYAALAELDLVLVPSQRHEATTRVILEAFSAGVPVVARRSGGIPEVVEHGVNGLLAQSKEEMAHWTIELLNGPSARLRSMSDRARQTWQHRFTLDRYRREILDALEFFAGNRHQALAAKAGAS